MRTYIIFFVLLLACCLNSFTLCAQSEEELFTSIVLHYRQAGKASNVSDFENALTSAHAQVEILRGANPKVDREVIGMRELREVFVQAAELMGNLGRDEQEAGIALLERLYPGFDLDSPKLELLPDELIPGFVDSYLNVYNGIQGRLNRYSYVLFNVKSEKVRNAYVLPFLRESFRQNGYGKQVADICEDVRWCSKTPETRKEVEALERQYGQLEAGKPAPEFMLKTPTGKAIKLSDLKGKQVFIGIFSSQTEQGAMDCFVALPDRFENIGKCVYCHVWMGEEKERETWQERVRRQGAGEMIFLFCETENALVRDYCVLQTPRYVFVDSDGTLTDAWHAAPGSKYFDLIFGNKEARNLLEKLGEK